MSLIRFPKTPYVNGSFVRSRSDKIVSIQETNDLLEKNVLIQEKIDGSLVGFSFSKAGEPIIQNKNSQIDVNFNNFYKKLNDWHSLNESDLFKICEDRYVLFGEWMFWEHSVKYNNLPSYFISFDIYDKNNNKFLSTKKQKEILKDTKIKSNPIIFEGRLESADNLNNYKIKSQFGDNIMEGIYLRVDDEDYNLKRYKYVNKSFSERINEHWKKKLLKTNSSDNIYEKQWAYTTKFLNK